MSIDFTKLPLSITSRVKNFVRETAEVGEAITEGVKDLPKLIQGPPGGTVLAAGERITKPFQEATRYEGILAPVAPASGVAPLLAQDDAKTNHTRNSYEIEKIHIPKPDRTLQELIERGDTIRQAPGFSLTNLFESFKDKLPFVNSRFEKSVKNQAIQDFPFNESARKIIQDLDVTDVSQIVGSPFTKYSDKEQARVGFEGAYRPAGRQLSTYLPDNNNEALTKVAKFLDREDIRLADFSSETFGHEILHSLFEKSTLSEEKDGIRFLDTWDSLTKKYPYLANIDEHLARSQGAYGDIFNNPYQLATERYAYLGQLVAGRGANVIPPELREFYLNAFKF